MHFYIEGQRIVSKLGNMGKNQELLNPKDTARAGNNIDWDNKQEHLKDFLLDNFEELGLTGAVFYSPINYFSGVRELASLGSAGKSDKVPYGQRRSPREHLKKYFTSEQIKKYYRNTGGIIDGYGSDSTSARNFDENKAELLQFYYHPDHLGSSNYITDVSGEVYQHMEYFPFGETFVEERTGTEYTTYLYNGKEFDEEIGLYYYGARYYDPRTSVWQSVDPLAERRIECSPYAYVLNNPILRFDPNGLTDYKFDKKTGEVKEVIYKDKAEQAANNAAKTDRIVQTDRNGNIKRKKFGKHKGEVKTTTVKNIEKGILSDGLNLKENDGFFKVNGEGQPSLEDFNKFISKFSDYAGKEIAGIRLGEEYNDEVKRVLTHKYKNSTRTKSETPKSWFSKYGSYLKGHFHTHPYNDHTPSNDFDILLRNKYPSLPFFIISGGHEKEF